MDRANAPRPPLSPTAATPTAATPTAATPTARTPTAASSALLTPEQAAERLNVTAKTLERWRGRGDGPIFVHLTSKTIRYRDQDLDAFIEGRLQKSTVPVAPATGARATAPAA